MKIAITGGSGFIGRDLINALLEKKHSVKVLTRNKETKNKINEAVDLYIGDLLDDNFVFDEFLEGVDILYHCAGILQEGDYLYETNVLGTKRLLEAAFGKIQHWVQLSSIGVYGKHKNGVVTVENAINPTNLYEKTKAEADKLVIEKSKEGKFTYSILRPSNVYGNYMKNQSLFKMIEMINRRFFFYIGNKRAIANYIHVNNVVESLILCGERKEAENEIFNISDHAKLETIVNVISKKLNKKTSILVFPKFILKIIATISMNWRKWPLTLSRIDALTNCTIYSNDKIERILGYIHLVSIEDGFGQLADYWKNMKLYK